MATISPKSPLSPLAQRVLTDHERAPGHSFYDLLTLGSFFDSGDVAQLDAAYAQLEELGFVVRAEGQSVNFGGNSRPMCRLANGQGTARRRSA